MNTITGIAIANMKRMERTITRTPTEKITITISRKQLWLNFMKFWSENVLYNPTETCKNFFSLKEIYNVLVTDKPLDRVVICKLFENANTAFFMDEEEMRALKTENALTEIIVIDDMGNDRPNIIIPHEYIRY